MYFYIPFRETLFYSENDVYRSYGVTVYDCSFVHFRNITSIPDVFLHIKPALSFCLRCTRYQLSPIHLQDLIYDTLSLY